MLNLRINDMMTQLNTTQTIIRLQCTGNPTVQAMVKYFAHSAAYTVYGHSSGGFDEYDDLTLVKQWGKKNPKIPEKYNARAIDQEGNDPSVIVTCESRQYRT